MREKKWRDCPVCGAKKSMRLQRGLRERINVRGYLPIEIVGLDGQFCDSCGDGFWSLRSEKKIARALGEDMARQDASRVVAAELVSVQEAASVLRVSAQGVHKMMDEGRLRYVLAGGRRLPVRGDVAAKAKAKVLEGRVVGSGSRRAKGEAPRRAGVVKGRPGL